jgi:hypothetical protein
LYIQRIPNQFLIPRRFSKEGIECFLDLRTLLGTFVIANAGKHVQPQSLRWLVEKAKMPPPAHPAKRNCLEST